MNERLSDLFRGVIINKGSTPSIYIIATGAGAGLQKDIWSIPGASWILAGAEFPYAREVTEETLGYKPEKFTSPETAIALAQRAYFRALAYHSGGQTIGLGMSCSVATNREKRGENLIYAAAMSNDKCIIAAYQLAQGKGEMLRASQDRIASDLGAEMILHLAGRLEGFASFPGRIEFSREAQKDFLNVFMSRPYHTKDGERLKRVYFNEISEECVLIPGTFNPIHSGHDSLANAAMIATGGRTPVLTITIDPPHKDSLTIQDLLHRSALLKGQNVFYSQGDPLFIDKARSHPGVPFAIGADTMDRMLDPKWCPVEPMLEEFHNLGTKFYVRGRIVNGEFLYRDNVANKWKLNEKDGSLFIHMPGRCDISSTEIRNGAKNG